MLRACLVALVLLSLAAPAAGAATKAQKRDARALLRPVKLLDAAVVRHEAGLSAAAEAWVDSMKPCEAEMDRLGDDDLDAAIAMLTVLGLDVSQTITAAIRADVERAAAIYATLAVRDKTLRALARLLARQARALVAMPDLDFCTSLAEWRQGGFANSAMPAAVAAANRAVNPAGSARTLARGAKRLRRFGLTRAQVDAIIGFPLPADLSAIAPRQG